MYNLSKDYKKLFKFICQKKIAVGFVDYKVRGIDKTFRDVVKIKRDKTNYISIGVRGVCYGSISHYDLSDTGKTEEKLFIELCKDCKLKWVLPTESKD